MVCIVINDQQQYSMILVEYYNVLLSILYTIVLSIQIDIIFYHFTTKNTVYRKIQLIASISIYSVQYNYKYTLFCIEL